MEGYIKDWRQELNSDIWLMPPLYHRIWQYLKYIANHKDEYVPMRNGTKLLIKRGQRLTSVRNIAEGVGYYERGIFKKPNPKTVQDVLNWLEENRMITIETGNRRYTLITIVNYCIYQGEQESKSNSQVTVSKQSLDINKNEKNEKNKDSTLEIENFRQRYDIETLQLIDEYLDILRTTRVSGQIADSVICKVYTEMDKYPIVVVKYACNTVINNPALHSKRENYFYGIMRNTKADEAERRLNSTSVQYYSDRRVAR